MANYSKAREQKISFISQISFLVAAFAGWLLTDTLFGMVSVIFFWFIILIVITLLRKQRVQKLFDATGVGKIDFMDQATFEKYLQQYFKEEGYIATLVPQKNKPGADITLKKGEQSIAIFAHATEKIAEANTIQHAVSCMNKYPTSEIWAITNYSYNAEAEGLAIQHNIKILDREDLLERALSRN